MVASSGQALSFLDTSAQAGVLYTYRIIPIHEELLQQGVWLEGKQAGSACAGADRQRNDFRAEKPDSRVGRAAQINKHRGGKTVPVLSYSVSS